MRKKTVLYYFFKKKTKSNDFNDPQLSITVQVQEEAISINKLISIQIRWKPVISELISSSHMKKMFM